MTLTYFRSETTYHPGAHDPTDLGDHLEDVTDAAVDPEHYRRAHSPGQAERAAARASAPLADLARGDASRASLPGVPG